MPRVKDVEKVYDKFVAHIAGDSKQPKSWENYIQDKLKFCRNVARILVQMVPKLKLRSIGNGQLLVDVPPPGRDETDHILVHSIDGPPRFDQLSAFGQAVGQTFEYWARCPRVFAAPDVAKKFIEAYGTEQELQKACHKAICQILNVPAEQMLWDDMNES